MSRYLSEYAPADIPSYVANADASNLGENGGVYNRAGRAFPDVSGKHEGPYEWRFRTWSFCRKPSALRYPLVV